MVSKSPPEVYIWALGPGRGPFLSWQNPPGTSKSIFLDLPGLATKSPLSRFCCCLLLLAAACQIIIGNPTSGGQSPRRPVFPTWTERKRKAAFSFFFYRSGESCLKYACGMFLVCVWCAFGVLFICLSYAFCKNCVCFCVLFVCFG